MPLHPYKIFKLALPKDAVCSALAACSDWVCHMSPSMAVQCQFDNVIWELI